MRGTTPTHTFGLPFNVDVIRKAKVSYKQGDKLLVKKNTKDCKLDGNTITVELTRSETVLFPDNDVIKVQLEIETKQGKALVTKVYSLYVDELLDEVALE